MPGLLDGKKGLILNIANDRSIATHIANNAIKHGATCGFGFLPMDNIEKSQRRVKKAMEENGFAEAWLHPGDVSSDESIESFFAPARDQRGTHGLLRPPASPTAPSSTGPPAGSASCRWTTSRSRSGG